MTQPPAVFGELESNVRTYCRRFPVVFTKAHEHLLVDAAGKSYVDFMSGAGALNYGHNHPEMRAALIGYLDAGGPVHSLDFHTEAKAEFLTAFRDVALAELPSRYRVQFTGPTGTNAVEAALKVARRATGRSGIVAFTNGFHGGSLGALAASSNVSKRAAAGIDLLGVVHVPYCDGTAESLDHLEFVLDNPSSGVALPAAVILETVQGEGGLGTATAPWLRRLQRIVRDRGVLLIVDDIQAGCGRTGAFFSFQRAGLDPDLVCLAKSISGFGLPMALTLIRDELDVLEPGAHAGTFRGNNLAFVTGRVALDLWTRKEFTDRLTDLCTQLDDRLTRLAERFGCTSKGRGMFRGLEFAEPGRASDVSMRAFAGGVLAETSGARGEVLKVMPPLTIHPDAMHEGLDVIEKALA